MKKLNIKKIITLTERDLTLIVKRVINESQQKQYLSIPKVGCETFVKGKCDPYTYIKEIEPDGKIRFFYKLSGETSWKESITSKSWDSIKNNVTFDTKENPNPEILPKRYVPNKNEKKKPTESDLNKILKDWKGIALGKYKSNELRDIINKHNFKYNFDIEDKNVFKNCFKGDKFICCSDYLMKKEDKNVNVYDKTNKIYDWRNSKINQFEKSSSYSSKQKKDAYNNLLEFSIMIKDKIESDFDKRWRGEISHELFTDETGYC